jgi:chromosome segregation ATPase
MKSQIIYKNFFIYCEQNKTCFFTDFSDGINIIHGKNTSGKSTIIQAIHFTFGINDEKHKLTEILNEKVIFRLDFYLRKEQNENITIVRDFDFIYIKIENKPLEKFSGINVNNSKEHIKLKKYLSDLFGFNLHLESSGEYKLASLEAMFLPYYVAQDYGWVLALNSFRGLDFFRNFKYDYYDYYLGITNEYDRLEKQELEKEKKYLETHIKFLKRIELQKDELELSKLKDESFVSKSNEYIESYKKNKDELIQKEKEFLLKCNELTFNNERLKILNRIKTSLKKENPIKDYCPTCNQRLPHLLENIYEYSQDVNNTDSEIKKIKEKIHTCPK